MLFRENSEKLETQIRKNWSRPRKKLITAALWPRPSSFGCDYYYTATIPCDKRVVSSIPAMANVDTLARNDSAVLLHRLLSLQGMQRSQLGSAGEGNGLLVALHGLEVWQDRIIYIL